MPDFTPRNAYSRPASGWTAASITPRATSVINDAVLPATPVTSAPLTTPVVPPPVTADTFRTPEQPLNNPSLGSRGFQSVPGGANVLAKTSVYETPNAPAFLADQVAALNAQQSMRRQYQNDLINQLMGLTGSGNPNAYLYAGALQAAVAQPGSGGGGGGWVFPQNPLIGQGYNAAAQAAAGLNTAQTAAITRPQQIQSQIADLQRRRSQFTSALPSMFGNPDAARIDQQIFDLQNQMQTAQSLATRAAGASSGWTASAIPRF